MPARQDGEVCAAVILPEVLPADVLGPTLPVLQRDEDVSPVSWGAQHLVSHLFHRIHSKFDHVQECGRKAAMARVYAAAAASTQFQQNSIREVVKLIARMRDHGEWDPILMLEHVRYDETPLDMRVYTGEGFDRECSKVFVVERGYSMLVHCNAVGRMPDARPKIGEGFFVLDVYMSPAMRSAANTSGETIQKLLSTLSNVSAEAAATFKHVVRLAEVDESGANLRAELFEMASDDREKWTSMLSLCMCHKVHTAAARGWDLQQATLTGIIHSCRFMSGTGRLTRFRQALSVLVSRRFKFFTENVVCSPEAKDFKRSALQSISLALEKPKRKAIIAVISAFLNTDWRSTTIGHSCPGKHCCKDAESSLIKCIWFLKKLYSMMRPATFQKANWTDWPNTLPFFSLAVSLHSVGLDAFQLAFAGGDTGLDDEEALRDALRRESRTPVSADAPDIVSLDGERLLSMPLADAVSQCAQGLDDDAVTRERIANAISHKAALVFMKKARLIESMWLLQVPLQPQQQLMRGLVKLTGAVWEREQLESMATLGTRSYRLGLFHRGNLLSTFFCQTMEILRSSHFEHLNSTELLRSKILKLVMRPAGLVHQLFQVRVANFPYALFALLHMPLDERLRYAEELLAKPKCLRDTWCKHFFQVFPTKEEVCSDTAMNMLAVLGKHAHGTTVATERLHSKNLRRSKGRTTHKIDLQMLAAPHSAFAAANWVPKPLHHQDKSGESSRKRKAAPAYQKHAQEFGESEVEPKKKKRKRRGGGGAWRAFCSEQLGARPFSAAALQELSRRYARLSPEESAHYKRLGNLGLPPSTKRYCAFPVFAMDKAAGLP